MAEGGGMGGREATAVSRLWRSRARLRERIRGTHPPTLLRIPLLDGGSSGVRSFGRTGSYGVDAGVSGLRDCQRSWVMWPRMTPELPGLPPNARERLECCDG